GLLGDAQLYVTGIILSPVLGGFAAIPAGLIAGTCAMLLLAFAAEIEFSGQIPDDGPRDRPARRRAAVRVPPDEDEGEDEGDDEPRRFQPIGAVAHAFLSLRARARRFLRPT